MAYKRTPTERKRAIAILIVFLSVVVGLILRTGWGTISSLGVDAVATLCPLGALETLVASRTMVPRALIMLVLAVVVMALVGRAFCAWVCPVPPIGRFFHAPGVVDGKDETDTLNAMDSQNESAAADSQSEIPHEPQAANNSTALVPVGGARDGVQIDSRHGVLLGALLSSAICGFPVFCLVCPVGLTFATVVCVYRLFVEQSPTWSLAVFVAILLVELVFFRKWCHKFCPLGALMSLVGARAPLFKARVNNVACLRSCGTDCRVCVQVCPEQLDPHSLHIPECTRCGVCKDRCPAHAITLGKGSKNSQPASQGAD